MSFGDVSFGSVCSGIEAASVAWHPLGWRAAWLAEIDKFASGVLAHHYPDVPNLGDMTTIAARIAGGEVEAPDVLVGGTPCQAFSVAGMRGGLSDARGALTISFVRLADAIDAARTVRGQQQSVIVWENVPGVLSSSDNAFGCFLAGLAGEGCELKPAGRRWSDAGCVYGPARAVAWRILDAQYFGLAQRRRRVFVVASARPGFDPAAVLFEFDGVRRDTPPSREPQQDPAGTLDAGLGRRRGSGMNPNQITGCWWDGGQVSQTLDAVLQKGQTMPEKNRFPAVLVPETAYTLRAEGFDASEDGTGRGTPLVPVAFSCKDHGADAGEVSPTLRAMGHSGSHANAGGQVAVAFHGSQDPDVSGDVTHPVGRNQGQETCAQVGMQVRRLTPRECERLQGFPDDYTRIPWKLGYWSADKHSPEVRAAIAEQCPDGPRYKALGNSMAVPVMRWIGSRIAGALAVPVPANDNRPPAEERSA